MADVGRLRWILTADTRQFEAGMSRARRSMMRLGRLAAGFIGGRALSAFLQTGLQTADMIGKIAQAAGVSTDAIQQLRFAFQEAGGTAAQFDDSLLRFNRRLGDLRARHAGPLATFLRETDAGLFVALKQAEDTSEAFLRLADAAAELSPARRGALLAAAFGRPSTAMNVLTAGGRAGIRAGMGRLPAGELISAAYIAEAERTNDEILRIQERAMLQVSKAALSVISFVQEIRRSLSTGGDSSGSNAFQQWISENFPWTVRALRFRGAIGRLWD